jgi:ABC-type sugar transport system ATPase subunit
VAELLLRARGLSKSFPGVRALEDVSLEIERGAVHALMGENGAGKSTLSRILAGLAEPEAGTIEFKGVPVRLRHPHEAIRLGISMIHQELLLFPEMTAAENVLMGQEPVRGWGGWLDRPRMNAEAARLLGRLGASIPPARKVKDLGVAERQTVEIAKALAHRADVLIMDEPTSSLSAREAEALFRVIADLKREGAAVLYISHKMEEVFRIADRVTVLRDGRLVGTHPIGELTPDRLIALMVGREIDLSSRRAPVEPGETMLEAVGLGRAGRFRGVSLRARRGEVLGLAGLVGAGRTEVLSALYGLAPADEGEIRVRGARAEIRSPQDALARGIALVGEDRKGLGLVGPMSVRQNITLSALRRYCRGPFVDRAREDAAAEGQIRGLGIRAAARDPGVLTLSGGNQQKVVIAKALLTEPDILLLDEPTRGIDVAAKAEVHAIVADLARRGKAVVMASSELPEVLSLCDRILVMREGAVSAELDPRNATQEDVMRHAVPA